MEKIKENYQKLTIDDIRDKRGDFKTVISVETGIERRFVHLLGYCYLTGEFGFSSKYCRLLEYCGFYIPLEEVVEKGLNVIETKYQEEIKQYITELNYNEVLSAYNEWVSEPDGTTHPPMMIDHLSLDTPDGVYILNDGEYKNKMKLYERFILEPRSPYSNRGSSDKCYLVIYDSVQARFLSEGQHNRYLRFKTSKEAFAFLSENYPEEVK